jgi:gas vesicle protein
MGQDAEELSTDTTTTGVSAGVGGGVAGSSTTPADIEATRASLSRDIDELTDKVSPARVVDRRKEAARGALSSVRDKVMGAAPDLSGVAAHVPGVGGSGSSGSSGPGVGERASGLVSDVSGSVSGLSGSVTSGASGAVDSLGARAQGNPLAAGLVAFGAGMLLSSLLPASERETRLASQAVDAAKEHGQPLVEQAKSVAAEVGGELKESATESVQQVKETAAESVQTVKAEGQSSAQTVKDDATPS